MGFNSFLFCLSLLHHVPLLSISLLVSRSNCRQYAGRTGGNRRMSRRAPRKTALVRQFPKRSSLAPAIGLRFRGNGARLIPTDLQCDHGKTSIRRRQTQRHPGSVVRRLQTLNRATRFASPHASTSFPYSPCLSLDAPTSTTNRGFAIENEKALLHRPTEVGGNDDDRPSFKGLVDLRDH